MSEEKHPEIDPCEDCQSKFSWFCMVACPVHRYEDIDDCEEDSR